MWKQSVRDKESVRKGISQKRERGGTIRNEKCVLVVVGRECGKRKRDKVSE